METQKIPNMDQSLLGTTRVNTAKFNLYKATPTWFPGSLPDQIHFIMWVGEKFHYSLHYLLQITQLDLLHSVLL